MKSYIIKNCPAYTCHNDIYDCWYNQLSWCKNITDCPLKRIYEKMKDCSCDFVSDFEIEEVEG